MNDYITMVTGSQAAENTIEKYAARKRAAMSIGALYWRTPFDKVGDQIYHCGDSMIVRRYDTGDIDTAYSMFCGARLCPVCAQRRSLKQYAQLSQILDYCDKQRVTQSGKPYSYIMITLTIRNCCDINTALDDMQQAFVRLKRSKLWTAAIKGAYRTTEITINANTQQYHPHYHVLCAVNPSYFASAAYISQDALTQAWRSCMRLDYDPVCHIVKCYAANGSDAKKEASKYILKSADPLSDMPVYNASVLLALLHDALQQRKMRMSYGIMRQAQTALGLSDADDDLLVDDDNDDALLASLRPETSFVYAIAQYMTDQRAYMLLPDIDRAGQDVITKHYIDRLRLLRADQAVVMGDNDDPVAVAQYAERRKMHKSKG